MTLNPIATTGYNADVIFEASIVDGNTGANNEFGSRQFYEAGISTYEEGVHKVGLRRSIMDFVSPTTSNTINFNFQPFEQDNMLKFDTTLPDPKSLTFAAPAPYSRLALVHSGGSLGTTSEWGLVDYTIHYAGGAMQTGVLTTADWGNATLPPDTDIFVRTGRLNAGANGMTAWPITPEGEAPTTNPDRWRMYVTEIATTNSTANIQSIEFSNPQRVMLVAGVPEGDPLPLNAGDDVVVFGVAGAPAGGGGGTFNAADFNHLNGVDAADLAIWKSNFGSTSATNSTGSADGDADVDGNDFLIWQRNLGAISSAGAAGAVPEPLSGSLALAAALAAAGARRRCHSSRGAAH
jgi:hypothetical protein